MSDNQVIPEAAVEAAAKVLVREQSNGCYTYRPEGHPKRDDLDRYADAHARAALEAATPHMLAVAFASFAQFISEPVHEGLDLHTLNQVRLEAQAIADAHRSQP